jgi:CTP:molybdopterin cytidylyltransferase MocA
MAATYHAGYGCPVDDQPRETIAAVVLAAGEGRRFGGPKQLHVIDGITMLERVLIAVERSGIATRLVVLGSRAEQITADVPLHGAVAVASPRWVDGQAASLRAGLDALPAEIDDALVVLGDGPGLDPRAIRRTAAAGHGVRAADYGRGRSHPVVLPRSHWAALPATGDTPARDLEARLVDCRGLPEPGDVDYAAP